MTMEHTTYLLTVEENVDHTKLGKDKEKAGTHIADGYSILATMRDSLTVP